MSKIDNDFEQYLSQHSTPEDEILAELVRFTNLTTYNPRMLCGHQQGLFLQMICQIFKPQNILEIGTFTGYSSICMARGIIPYGHIDTIEVNDELEDVILKFLDLAGVKQYVNLHLGNALDIIPKLNTTYNLVYIDGDKREYQEYYKIVFPKVKLGGYIFADNVLWNGKVIDSHCKDKHTKSVLEFNRIVQKDPRVQNVLLPLRDGLMIIRKIYD